uniref:FERM domain-containing protein n=1 Tax=Panagrellus redivivus TaxID=6233 RepID=A0A7E4ZYX9_PANRE
MSTLGEQQGARVNELNNGVVQQGVPEKYLQKAVVTLPSGNVTNFFVHKKSKGNVLTDLVSEHEGLLEKDYFGLNYVDHFGEKTWLYPDKRIAKQLNKEPWNFTLRVKFYAPEPSVLADDLTRYLLYLQVRKDVYDETLPTSYPTKILLAAIVMQAETGDFETTEQSPEEYDQFVRNARLVPSVDQEFLAKVREAHKEQKGLTTQEAHLKYLDAAKALAKYGYTFFQGKDVKNGNVTIGIHAHGITVYKDQVQIHKFLWQSIEKIQYSSNKFSILLKPGELDEKKQVTVRYSMPDYYTAKRLYRTAVEHHTFFRLIRPEDPPKSGLLSRVGSEHFRYQGRTYFQAKMASQMFDNPTTTVQRTPSGRQVSRSVDDLAIQRSFPASPLHYADESTHQATSPEKSKSYSLSSKHKDERTPLSVVVHETNEAYPGSKRSSTSSASIVSPFSGEYIVSSRPYTPRDEATTSPYEDVVFPLAISPSERQRNVRTPTKSAASTSQRNSRVRFFDGGPVTPDDGSAVAMAPAGKPGKRTAKRRLFGPVNDDHTAFAPVDDLYRSPEIVNVPLDSKVSVYDRGWYTATLPSTSAQQSVPFFVCCKPTKAVRREFDILRDFDNGIIDQSNLHKRSELDSYPLRYYSSVYHSGLPPTKRRKWVTSKDEDVIPADRLNPEYYVFGSERDYSPERFERVTEAETVPLRQVSRVYWHGGTSKPNTKVVEVAPESRIVRTTTTQQRTAPSTSTETVERSFVEHDLPVHEVKTTTVERSGQPGDEYTITTTRIETTTILESEAQPSTSEEYVPPPQNKTVVKERVSSSRYPVITEAYNGPIDVIPKSRDLDLLPIKRFANVYHPGISEERVTPITWIRKQKTSLLDRRRDSNRPTISETSESSFPSKSTHHEKIVSRKRLHSLSQHYPVIGEAYEGPVNTISPTIEAESANLFDCVSFASVDEAGPSESPTDKKVSRSLKYSLPRCVCGWCGPQERHLIEDQYPYDVEPYTGPVENLTRDGQLSHAELETCVNFQVEEEPERVEEEPKKIHVVQEIPTINIHEEPSLHESDTDEDVPAISGVEYDMSINMHKPNDAAYAECVIEIPSPQINVTFESRSEEVHEHRSTVATETTIIREKVESNIPDYDIENVEPVRSSAVIERRPSSPVPTEPQPIHVIDYELSRIDSRRVKFDPETSKSAHPRAELITEEVSYPVHEPLSQQRRPASNEGCGLFCGTNKKAIQDDPYDVTGEHHVTTKDSPSTLSKNYPVIGEPFDGEYADLSHQPEAEFTDLFDTISFVSSSEDSGIGGETTAQRPKPKKTGLKCLWCGPSKSQRKTSEESLKAVNVHEQQVQRRNVIKKAETYALSEHYPVAEAYSGEVVSLNKAELAPEANLFDLIDFIPSESETSSSKDLKPKKSGLKCLWCGFTKSRGVQTDLTQRRSNGKCVPLNCLAKKSNESRYPIDVEPYVGPVFELERPAEAPSANLFDTISFATDDEDHVSLQLHNNGDLRRASSEAHEPAPVVNVPEVRRESTSDPTAKPRILASTENVDMVFVHKLHSNEPIASTSSVAEPSTQQQTVEDVHVAEAQNVALYKHMDDVVDLAVPSTSHEVEEPVHGGLRCIPCVGKSSKKPIERRPSHHESIVKAKTLHSLSKNYPVIGERFEGELAELPHQPEAKSVDLFDTISFVSSSEDSGVGGDTAAQRPKPKKTGLKCLWCGPSKSQRKTSEESLKAVNVHEQQVQRNRFVRKARTYSTSEHYPAEQVPYEGEVFEIVKANEVPAVNLFDTISFAPSTDEEEQPTAELVHKKKSPKCGLLCAPCLGRRSALPEVDEEPERLVVQHELPSAEEPVAKVEVRPVTPVEVTVTRREVVVETPVVEIEPPVVEYEPPVVVERIERVAKKVEIETVQRPREPSISAGYPVITEPYSGSLHDLQKDYEAPGADLFEHVEFVQPSIEVVDLAVPSTSHEVEEPFVAARTPTPPTERQVAADKGCGLWCGGRNKAVDEPYAGTRRLSHHESIVKAKKVHSLSKNYPVIGERFEGELAELPHQPEAKSVDLFDTISFVSS